MWFICFLNVKAAVKVLYFFNTFYNYRLFVLNIRARFYPFQPVGRHTVGFINLYQQQKVR
jgi:hypothetical protein